MRLLFASNLITVKTGYGVQAASLLPRLAKLPEFGGRHSIAQYAGYGLQGSTIELGGFRIYQGGNDPWGNDILDSHARDFDADIVITMMDIWVLHDTARKLAPIKWLPYFPVDHDPVPPAVLDALAGAYLPLTYSQWGRSKLLERGIDSVYIPLGIEPKIYQVLPDRAAVAQIRREIFRGADHLTVMVAANKGYPDRKAFQVQLRAWALFAKDKPDAYLYIHTDPTTVHQGIDFHALLDNLGIQERVFFPDRYQYGCGIPAEYLARVYNAADVFLGASMGEGFGIPIIEAQACGTPVIVSDFSSMPELVRWGCKVTPRDIVWTPLNSWQCWPDVDGIVQMLESLYADWRSYGGDWPLTMRQQTSDAIHQEYGWDMIVRSYWAPLVALLAGRTVK